MHFVTRLKSIKLAELVPQLLERAGEAGHALALLRHDVRRRAQHALATAIRAALEGEGRARVVAWVLGYPRSCSALAERLTGGRYVDVQVDRQAAGRHCLISGTRS